MSSNSGGPPQATAGHPPIPPGYMPQASPDRAMQEDNDSDFSTNRCPAGPAIAPLSSDAAGADSQRPYSEEQSLVYTSSVGALMPSYPERAYSDAEEFNRDEQVYPPRA